MWGKQSMNDVLMNMICTFKKKNQREDSQMMLIYKAEEDSIFINYL